MDERETVGQEESAQREVLSAEIVRQVAERVYQLWRRDCEIARERGVYRRFSDR